MNSLIFLMENLAALAERMMRRYGLVAGIVALVMALTVLSHTGVLPLSAGFFGFYAVMFLLLALYRPWWAFLTFVALLPLETVTLAPAGWGVDVRPYQAAGALTLLSLGIRALSGRLPRRLPRWHVADAAVVLLVAGGFLAVVGSADAGAALRQAIIIGSCAVWYFLARYFVRGPVTARTPLAVFLLAAGVVVAYGIWQNVAFLHGMPSGEVMPGRPNATLAEPDWLGMFLALTVAVAVALAYAYRHAGRAVAMVGLALTAPVALLLMTVARSAWLAAATVPVCALGLLVARWALLRYRGDTMARWHAGRLLRQLPILGAVVLVPVAVAWFVVTAVPLTRFDLSGRAESTASGRQEITVACIPGTDTARVAVMTWEQVTAELCDVAVCACRHIDLEVINTEKAVGNIVLTVDRADPSTTVRADLYRTTVALLRDHWLLGMGWGQASGVLGVDDRGAALNASNIFLETWLGAGLLGLTALLVLLGDIVWRSGRAFLGLDFWPDDWQATYVLASLLGVAALVVANLFNAGAYLGFLWAFLGAVAHGATAYADHDARSAGVSPRQSS